MCAIDLEIEIETRTINVELQKAFLDDIRELDYNKEVAHKKFTPVFKLRENLPFWLIDSKGVLQPQTYFLHNGVDKKDIYNYLKNGQIYIHKSFIK